MNVESLRLSDDQRPARSLVHAGLEGLPGPVRLKCQKKSTAALQFYLQEGGQIVGEGVYVLMEYGPDERGARELR